MHITLDMYQEQPDPQNKIFFLLYFGELYITASDILKRKMIPVP